MFDTFEYVMTHGRFDPFTTVPLGDGEASVTDTCLACRGTGSRVAYVESGTGAVIDVPCPACDGYGTVEGITYSPGEACHDRDLQDMHDFEVMSGTY